MSIVLLGILCVILAIVAINIIEDFVWAAGDPWYLNPPDSAHLSRLAEVIWEYNTTHPLLSKTGVFRNPIRGTVIHMITANQAITIAAIIQAVVKVTGYPITFLLACLAIESVLDPACENHNIGPGESNEGNKLGQAGWDMGIGQFKLGELISKTMTLAQALAYAMNPSWAIPYHVRDMQGEVEWAKGIIAQGDSNADYRFSNPYVLATCAYNFGRTGVLEEYYSKGLFPDGQDGRKVHGIDVMQDEAYFALKLGVPSIFKDLVKS